ncbi:metallophosphoesterase family protein [Niallia nealsonii]|uniref:DNA repair exonuclease n=1 Tax=Niallia nealsonii TaxID=115979 RepID=A0A2N0Z7F7_9BACI|nr:DNA repair exonuclease [Niallia nealsonii]PKG25441.1 DNA repair exonuclease [Niallia nealsonii]
MKKVSFIHCADLHLDSPITGLRNVPNFIVKRLQESTFSSFSAIIDKAIAYKVDFIIIAGDIFDGEDRSIKAQIRFRKEMERLHAHHIAAYIIHGNHDHLKGSWTKIVFPDNVYVFPVEVTAKTYKKENTTVELYGFSYEARHIMERKIADYKRKETGDYHIGILHGNLEGSSGHSPYAPFSMQELTAKQMDYWALGHIHKRAILADEPLIVYPGNIQGRHKKETGEKGGYFVQLNEIDTKIEFFSTATIVWKNIIFDATGIQTLDELMLLVNQKVEGERKAGRSFILFLEIHQLMITDSIDEMELLEILQQEPVEEEEFIWVASIKYKENKRWIKDHLVNESEFYKELFAAANNLQNVEKALDPLYGHPAAHRYLSELTDEEKKELAVEAENILIKLLN